ncbi:MAG: fatty acid desaturase [Bacteroidota bacterium]
MAQTNQFRFSTGPEPHRGRTREIMIKHPQIRTLMGKNPATILAILGLVGGMVAGAWLVRDASWWIVVAAAYIGGAFANHALFVMIHECTHNLLFKKKGLNLAAAIVANLPHMFPSAISFVRYHIKHHSFQGVHETGWRPPRLLGSEADQSFFYRKSDVAVVLSCLPGYPHIQAERDQTSR